MERRQNYAFLFVLLATFSLFGLTLSIPMNNMLIATDTAKATHSASEAGTAAKIAEEVKFSDAPDVAFIDRNGDSVKGVLETATDGGKTAESLNFGSKANMLPPHVIVEPIPQPKPSLYAKTKAFFVRIWRKMMGVFRKSPLGKLSRKVSNSKTAKQTNNYFQKGRGWINEKWSKSKSIPKTSESVNVSPGAEHNIPELNSVKPEASAKQNMLEVNSVQPEAAANPVNTKVEEPATIKTESTASVESQPESTLSGKTEPKVNGEPEKAQEKAEPKPENSDPVSKPPPPPTNQAQ
ncbi:hypothetical protein PPACK8108_LOCUS22916 [Phakopsora pachyrhizi]|uniref:Uncharacterized protein n=1 Tax=Phakopsora pachyrhizi TaxID=170000 RepID=A0AAV0BPR1_PHAPC|nr:hypothetical protein PPACK8108_LOCUS22916 [Phakopsora pachyrhizi]